MHGLCYTYAIQCTLYSMQYTVYTMQYTRIEYMAYIAQCTLHNVHCIHNEHCIQNVHGVYTT